jgi:FkbM family methyltransferase
MIAEELVENENAKTDATNGEYERYYKLEPDDVVLDCGGHFGYFTELAANKCKFVVTLEPHPFNFSQLAKRTEGMDNVSINNLAAWDSFAELDLWEYPNHSGGHTLFRENIPAVKSYKVQAVDVGQFLKDKGIVPTFMKIDAESAELKILESLFRHGFKVPLTVECHGEELYDDCRRLAEQNGMTFYPETRHVGVCFAMPK